MNSLNLFNIPTLMWCRFKIVVIEWKNCIYSYILIYVLHMQCHISYSTLFTKGISTLTKKCSHLQRIKKPSWPDQVTVFHMPRQFCCRGMCKIVVWWGHKNNKICIKGIKRFWLWAPESCVKWVPCPRPGPCVLRETGQSVYRQWWWYIHIP